MICFPQHVSDVIDSLNHLVGFDGSSRIAARTVSQTSADAIQQSNFECIAMHCNDNIRQSCFRCFCDNAELCRSLRSADAY